MREGRWSLSCVVAVVVSAGLGCGDQLAGELRLIVEPPGLFQVSTEVVVEVERNGVDDPLLLEMQPGGTTTLLATGETRATLELSSDSGGDYPAAVTARSFKSGEALAEVDFRASSWGPVGTRDKTFATFDTVFILEDGDGYLLVRRHSLERVDADFNRDPTFAYDGFLLIPELVGAVARLRDGRILLATLSASSEVLVRRVDGDQLDSTFDLVVLDTETFPTALDEVDGGFVALSQRFDRATWIATTTIESRDRSGAPRAPTLEIPGVRVLRTLREQSGGLFLVGLEGTGDPASQLWLARYRPDGSLDPGVGAAGITYPLALQPLAIIPYQNGYLIAAHNLDRTGAASLHYVHVDLDGGLDEGFGDGGVLVTELGSGAVSHHLVDDLGRIYLSSRTFGVLLSTRLLPDLRPDPDYNGGEQLEIANEDVGIPWQVLDHTGALVVGLGHNAYRLWPKLED